MSIDVKIIDKRNNILFVIRELEDFEKNKAVRSGLSAAARVLMQAGKTTLRSRSKKFTGNLLSSFTTRLHKKGLGVVVGFNSKGGHAHLIDLGTVQRIRKKGGSTGVMPGNRFWTDTKEKESTRVLDAMYRGIEVAVDKINYRKV